jgi:hypothetical protein
VTDQNPNIESRIDRIEVTLSHAVEAIEKLASVVNAPQETKWGPILTALALLFAAAGGYTTLITIPIEREADQLRTKIYKLEERELERERDLGRIEGKLGIKLDE